jgi:hypothetical protein
MPRYLLAVSIPTAETGACASREWRVRAAAGELRRQGLAVVFERAVPLGEEGRCLFLLVAVSEAVVRQLAALAELGNAGIAEAGARRASVA